MNKLKCQPLIFQFYSLFILDEPNPIEPHVMLVSIVIFQYHNT